MNKIEETVIWQAQRIAELEDEKTVLKHKLNYMKEQVESNTTYISAYWDCSCGCRSRGQYRCGNCGSLKKKELGNDV